MTYSKVQLFEAHATIFPAIQQNSVIRIHSRLDLRKVSGIAYHISRMSLNVSECKEFVLLLQYCSLLNFLIGCSASLFSFQAPHPRITLTEILNRTTLIRVSSVTFLWSTNYGNTRPSISFTHLSTPNLWRIFCLSSFFPTIVFP